MASIKRTAFMGVVGVSAIHRWHLRLKLYLSMAFTSDMGHKRYGHTNTPLTVSIHVHEFNKVYSARGWNASALRVPYVSIGLSHTSGHTRENSIFSSFSLVWLVVNGSTLKHLRWAIGVRGNWKRLRFYDFSRPRCIIKRRLRTPFVCFEMVCECVHSQYKIRVAF